MQTTRQAWSYFLGALLFGVVAVVPGAASLYNVLAGPLAAIRDSADWVETPCVILESGVTAIEDRSVRHDGHRSSGPTYHQVAVLYEYQYEGQDYTSDRYDFYKVHTGEYQWKEDVVAKLPPGTRTVCHVNPRNPSEAVLSRSRNVRFVTAIPGLFFLSFGLFCLYAAFEVRPWRRR